ncbi:toll-like protein [Tribolium castaneum]|uniref:Toll-like protein n=3 Tax=Tribolium castaneum TaxID=7070 RepID=D6WCW7_TRICA|nr:toll-like protein [Tribolium castaneum]
MKNVWLVLLLLIYFKPSTSLKCNRDDKKCLCLPGAEFEFQCPSSFENGDTGDYPDYVIHIKEDKDILIDCSPNLKQFNITSLPNVTIERTESFRMRFCPLPPRNFKEVLDWFGIKQVKYLQYSHYELANTTLTKDYFEGLEDLEKLSLENNGLVDVEEDVFANTPKLTSLDLQVNKIKLGANLFNNTPLLKSLDISQNNLDYLPPDLFKKLEDLELLHVWDNKIRFIDDSTFQGLTNVKSIELSGNLIETITENAFKNLSNLERVNLSMNKLQYVPGDLFRHNQKLKLVLLKMNEGLYLPGYLFSNMSQLEEVDLTDCKLKGISSDIFKHSLNLKRIKLAHNTLDFIPQTLFEGLTNLEEIYLNNNNIETIDQIFKTLRQLKILTLEGNRIRDVGKAAFDDLIRLEKIILRHNQITKIDNRAFYNNGNLKTIDLAHNQITGNYSSKLVLLENVHDAETIDLSHNLITRVDDIVTMYNKNKLKSLDLSYNRIEVIGLQELQPFTKKVIIKLDHNHIKTVDFSYVEVVATSGDAKDALSDPDPWHSVIDLNENPLNCDCHNFDLVRYVTNELRPEIKVMFDLKMDNLKCANPPPLEDFPVESLVPKLLICPVEDGCPERCLCSQRPFDRTIIINCADKNLTQYPQLNLSDFTNIDFVQTEVHLEGNSLNTGPGKNLTGYGNVTELSLSSNKIETISWVPPNIKVLKLDNNKISYLNWEVLHTLNESNLHSLTLHNNPWTCDCQAANLTNFLRQNPKILDAKHVYCFNSTNRLIELNRTDLCHEWQVVYLVLIVLSVLFFVALAFALYYRYQQELKVWLFAHNLCLWWVTEEELDKDKIYDAFISYSHKDEDFVTQNLLPVLEGGPQPYKLCLHYRNWIPGEFITTQVTNSVLESRRTLVVLSPNFLESVWGKMEFRTAHTQAMTEGRARVIIVLYGDVDVDSLDDELKTYLKTNTYVKWGDPYFWNKLKYALPHTKRNVANQQKMANVMNCIDDKFKLVVPVTNSPGSTPPVLALDANMLKHPLNFVPSQEMDTPPAEAGTLLVSTGL